MKPMQGSAEEVTLVLKNVRPPEGPTLSEVALGSTGLHISGPPLGAFLDRPAGVHVTIKTHDLQEFIDKNLGDRFRDCVVHVTHEGIRLEGQIKALLAVPFTAEVMPIVKGDRQIEIELISASIMGASTPGMVQSQLDKLNPVFDTTKFPVDLRLVSVTCEYGQIRIVGELTPLGQ